MTSQNLSTSIYSSQCYSQLNRILQNASASFSLSKGMVISSKEYSGKIRLDDLSSFLKNKFILWPSSAYDKENLRGICQKITRWYKKEDTAVEQFGTAALFMRIFRCNVHCWNSFLACSSRCHWSLNERSLANYYTESEWKKEFPYSKFPENAQVTCCDRKLNNQRRKWVYKIRPQDIVKARKNNALSFCLWEKIL